MIKYWESTLSWPPGCPRNGVHLCVCCKNILSHGKGIIPFFLYNSCDGKRYGVSGWELVSPDI